MSSFGKRQRYIMDVNESEKDNTSAHRIYNSPLELSIRTLIILKSLGRPIDLDKLMYLDHLALNTEDIDGPPSIHAPIPHRGVQIFARKELIQKGITILLSKELVSVIASPDGIFYQINETGKKFIEYFSTEYFIELSNAIMWVAEKFNTLSTREIKEFVDENLEKWSGEFLTISTN